jgi:hypothetical protein
MVVECVHGKRYWQSAYTCSKCAYMHPITTAAAAAAAAATVGVSRCTVVTAGAPSLALSEQAH